jgi:hypothetical protein
MKGPRTRGCDGVPPEVIRRLIETLLSKQRELERLARDLEIRMERVDRVARAFEDLIAALRASVDVGTVSAPVRRLTPAEVCVLREEARVGVSVLALRWNDDGSAEVRVNGGKPFRLQHRRRQ